jgi:hypothetical protein
MAGIALVCAWALDCGEGASWTDTFRGVDNRFTSDAGPTDVDGGSVDCTGLTLLAPVTPITVTFPGYGTANPTIHIAFGTSSCDLDIDTTEDGVVFVSDASPCVTLLAPSSPSSSTATAAGSPTDLLFSWTLGGVCTLEDDYALSRE